MLIVISSPPDSEAARVSVRQAAYETADIILKGAAVAMARKGGLEGFCGSAFVLDTDLASAGIKESELERGTLVMSMERLRQLVEKEGLAEGSEGL